MNVFLTRWQRDHGTKPRQRWLMLAQRRRDAINVYFPLGPSRSVLVYGGAMALAYVVWRMVA